MQVLWPPKGASGITSNRLLINVGMRAAAKSSEFLRAGVEWPDMRALPLSARGIAPQSPLIITPIRERI